MDVRKLIKREMERFKICEKETKTKTKAFSKEGLGQQPKTICIVDCVIVFHYGQIIDFSLGEESLVTCSSHEPSNPRNTHRVVLNLMRELEK
ncbi:putative CCR4-Not complex component, Not domain-containing protein [Helianthus annuus]|nr:putative CCR4-Not complex component, Not domain-containing protein [Helianthus annuus]